MKKNLQMLLVLITLVPLAACSSSGEKKPDGEVPSEIHVEGDHIVVDRHINFATDSDVILDDSTDLMDQMRNLLTANTDDIKVVKIIGHTDSTGDAAHNKELSERRAAAVKIALTERGVTQRLVAWGMGPDAPLCSDDTPECHDKNRRVEFLILQEDDPSLLEVAVEGTEKAVGMAVEDTGDAVEATGEAIENAGENMEKAGEEAQPEG